MKNLCFALLAIVFLAVSCSKEKAVEADTQVDLQEEVLDNSLAELNSEQLELKALAEDDVKFLDKYEVPAEHLELLKELGYGGSTMQVLERTDKVNQETFISYRIESDIEVRQDHLEMLIAEGGDVEERQYRTTNLVNGPRTIRVTGLYITQPNIGSGLRWAIDNYNRLPLNLTFTLTYSNPSNIWQLISVYLNSDIIVREVNNSSGGAVAGFPSGGNPYNRVDINTGTNGFGANVCEHVLGHEIGHCLGLRHTDWFNRSLSCGTGGSEGQAGVGAIHIPGTPAMVNIDANSQMKACFNGTENGEFTNFDVVALTTLY